MRVLISILLLLCSKAFAVDSNNGHQLYSISDSFLEINLPSYKPFGTNDFSFLVYEGNYDLLKAAQKDFKFYDQSANNLSQNLIFNAYNIHINNNVWRVIELSPKTKELLKHIASCRKSYGNGVVSCDFIINFETQYIEFSLDQTNFHLVEKLANILIMHVNSGERCIFWPKVNTHTGLL